MGDMLIALYCLPPPPPAPPRDVTVRKPIGPEHDLVVRWVATNFSAGWASESRVALGNRPPSLFIATRADTLLGFCAYDATARGLVGPIGVAESARGQGVGAALLRGCLDEMRAAGYAYAVAGAVGAPALFARAAGAVPIAGSTPGLYRGLLRDPPV
ncbi:MAG: GNAT family N-acetyltransferase [Betaproteobacteria bacterium]|nr:GNAT family N-acetyltransferase [Betaproteobacteria bacterium]